ncbi:MAG: insulinase family protein [Ignavibacteriales bacterium]|nr:insulinase family protein [Ignavibacteriales bacterium]
MKLELAEMAYRAKSSHTQSVANTSYKKTTLANGIRVISEEIPTVKSASIGIWINTGSRNESPEINGITHFIEHMMFKGTKKRNFIQIAQSLESVGGYMNAFTTKEHTCYYARVLDEYVENAIDVLSDMVQNSTYPVKEMEKEKTVVLEEIKRSEDDPDDVVNEYFEKHLFGDHPFARPIIGTAENITKFSQDDLFAYTKRFYTNENIILTAAGNLKHEQLVRLAEKYLTMKRKSFEKRTTFASSKQKHFSKEYSKPIQQAHLCTGTLAFDVHSKLRYPGLVMNSVLGDGMSSRLFQQIREKHGLAYSVYSFLSMTSEIGAFGIYVGTDKKMVNNALDLSYKELEKIKSTPLKKSELQRAKAQLKGSMLMSLESTSNRMMRLGSGELYFGEYKTLDSIVKNIDAVTADDVQKVANQLFNIQNFTTVVLSPEVKN